MVDLAALQAQDPHQPNHADLRADSIQWRVFVRALSRGAFSLVAYEEERMHPTPLSLTDSDYEYEYDYDHTSYDEAEFEREQQEDISH
jgi:hypothetical protein